MSSNESSNFENNNQQILNDIYTLQTFEQELITKLGQSTDSTIQAEMITKINQISNMRINLYQTLSNLNTLYTNNLTSTQYTLKDQTDAIAIIESELNTSKEKLNELEQDKTNKIRLIEINNYYGDKYQEHSSLMKIIIFTLVPIIILAILYNKEIIPTNIYYGLIAIVSAIGAYFLWYRYFSIITRDSMNYQEYDWYFNASSAPKIADSTVASDPWASNLNIGLTCIGQECCSTGQTYDSSLNQCISDTSCTVTESFVNNVLTKKEYKYKPDINLNSNLILPHNS